MRVPKDIFDTKAARALVEMGYPAVAPVLPDLLKWLQDYNWPVAHVLAPFLASIGEPLVPELRRIFAGNDVVWKYWCLQCLVDKFPKDVVEQLRPELEQMANRPSPDEKQDEVDVEASLILEKLTSHGSLPPST